MLRLLPIGDRGRDVEILALRHQIMALQRQLGSERVRFGPADRSILAALLHRLPRDVLRRARAILGTFAIVVSAVAIWRFPLGGQLTSPDLRLPASTSALR